jgi:hypothetical protein
MLITMTGAGTLPSPTKAMFMLSPSEHQAETREELEPLIRYQRRGTEASLVAVDVWENFFAGSFAASSCDDLY